MLFALRRWSIKVMEEMGLPVASKEATILIDLLIWSSKVEAQMLRQARVPLLSKPERILMGAIKMVHNPTAIDKVSNDLRIHPQAAEDLLNVMRNSGLALASRHGFELLLQTENRYRRS